MKILVLVHIKYKHVGGSLISAASFANDLVAKGNEVWFIGDKDNFAIESYLGSEVNIIDYKFNKFWFLKKQYQILKTIRSLGIDSIVAFDRQSAYVSVVPSWLYKVNITPIIPGGSKDTLRIEPLRIPTVVFSQENKQDLIEKFGWDEDNISVVPARITCDNFKYIDKYSINGSIGFISRIVEFKRESFSFLLQELEDRNLERSIEIDVIGSGDDLDYWKEMAEKVPIRINFLGQIKLKEELLSRYKLIIGQGRVVLEAMSCGIPSAISGENGYKGLINSKNIDDFSKTNFTGRAISINSTLSKDLSTLEHLTDNTRKELSDIIKSRHDIGILSEFVLTRKDFRNIPNYHVVARLFINLVKHVL